MCSVLQLHIAEMTMQLAHHKTCAFQDMRYFTPQCVKRDVCCLQAACLRCSTNRPSCSIWGVKYFSMCIAPCTKMASAVTVLFNALAAQSLLDHSMTCRSTVRVSLVEELTIDRLRQHMVEDQLGIVAAAADPTLETSCALHPQQLHHLP